MELEVKEQWVDLKCPAKFLFVVDMHIAETAAKSLFPLSQSCELHTRKCGSCVHSYNVVL